LNPESEEKIRDWLREQTVARIKPTLLDIKQQVVGQLEIDHPKGTAVRVAQPLEEECYAVTPQQI
jgi:hypothetical protein